MDEKQATFLHFLSIDLVQLEIQIADYTQGKYSMADFFKILATAVFNIAMKAIEFHQKFIGEKGN